MTAPITALENAKRLQGVLVRLAERRERQVARATGEFQLDLLAFISDKSDELIEMVRRGLALDHSQPYLQLALGEAIAQKREQREGDGVDFVRARNFRFESERPTEPAQLNPMPSFEATRELPSGEVAESRLLQAGAFELSAVEAAEVMRDAPPPRFEVQEAEGVDELLPPMPDSAYPADAVELPVAFRYPEPGEPATVLEDGTVVALDSGTLDGGSP